MTTDQLEFNVGEDESPATVQLKEDGTAEQVNKPQDPEVSVSAQKSDTRSEVDQYSEGVQKRIDKLTARLRETQRREQAALEYAKNVQARAQQLEQQYLHTDQDRINEAKGRIETQVVALKQIIRKAREESDVDTETEAQQRLAALTLESSQVSHAEAQRQAYMQQVALQQQHAAQQAAMQRAQPQTTQPQDLDPRVEEWVEKNPWYGRDTVMTHAAWGIHRQLIEVEGVDPSSDTYYDEINRRIRDAFPRKFAQSGTTRNVQQTVAPASRSTGLNQAARRTVKLTPSQVAIAKKLGVPLEEYAKYVKE
jgi:hypothetical protein